MKLNAIIWKEEDCYVITEIFTDDTSQGNSIEEAIENIKEAVELYLEEMPEIREELEKKDVVGVLNVKITRTAG